MTVKEFNKIRRTIYDACLSESEILRHTVETFGHASIYELESPNNHGFMIVTNTSQVNGASIKDAGFDPDVTTVKKVLYLDRATKCVTF